MKIHWILVCAFFISAGAAFAQDDTVDKLNAAADDMRAAYKSRDRCLAEALKGVPCLKEQLAVKKAQAELDSRLAVAQGEIDALHAAAKKATPTVQKEIALRVNDLQKAVDLAKIERVDPSSPPAPSVDDGLDKAITDFAAQQTKKDCERSVCKPDEQKEYDIA